MARRLQNITITLDPDTAADARVEAAERNMSLSRFVGEVLRERRRRAGAYEEAMRRFFATKLVIRRKPGERYFTREEANDRAGLRRR